MRKALSPHSKKLSVPCEGSPLVKNTRCHNQRPVSENADYTD